MTKFINNIISFFTYINFLLLSLFFRKNNKAVRNDILFINTGQIGDLTVSSMIFDNDDFFNDNTNVYFLMKEHYRELFTNYTGKVKILTYDYNKYKWNIFYRIKLLKKLNRLNINSVYNITAARGILNDEITLLSGAKEKYTICNNHKYLGGFFGEKMDIKYDDILFQNERNEYKKHITLLKLFFNKEPALINTKSFDVSNFSDFISNKGYEAGKYIVISPLASEIIKTWGIDNYKKLCSHLSKKYKIILNGSESEKKYLQYISEGLDNTFVETFKLEILPALIAYSKLFIGNDSGATHIALKLNVPLIAILFGGNFNMFFPFKENEKKFVFLYNILDCFECESGCIYDKPLCLTQITLEQVMEKIGNILS